MPMPNQKKASTADVGKWTQKKPPVVLQPSKSTKGDKNETAIRKQTHIQGRILNIPYTRKLNTPTTGTIPNFDVEQQRILKDPGFKWQKEIPTKLPTARSAGLELLRRIKFLFVRISKEEATFFQGCKQKFDVYDENGARVYFVKEMDGDGQQRFSLGGRFDIILCILSCGDGRELMRVEGNRGKNGSIGSGLSVFIGPLFVGDIVVKRGLCSSPLYHVVDDSQKEIAIIKQSKMRLSDGSRNFRSSRCCCCKTRSDTENAFYDVYIPETKSRIGSMGKIAKFFTEVSRDLDDAFGVELSDAMSNKEKAMLMASIFIMDRQLLVRRNSQNTHDTNVKSSIQDDIVSISHPDNLDIKSNAHSQGDAVSHNI